MKITLDNGTEVEVLNINLVHNLVDWRRTTGNTNACVSVVELTSAETAPAEIKAALEIEIGA